MATEAPTAYPSPSPTAAQTPSTTPQGRGLQIEWRQLDRDPGFGFAWRIVASAAANDRFVIATDGDDLTSALYTSDNGRSWDQSDLDQDADVEISDVVAGGPGFVAVGRDYDEDVDVAYVSDDGRVWDRFVVSAGTGTLRDLGRVGSRVVVRGDQGMAFSDDGETWLGVTEPDGFGRLLDFASGDTVILAFTVEPRAGRYDHRTQVWRSSDGASWQRAGFLPDGEGVDGAVAAAGPLGWVVIGFAERRSGAIEPVSWFSSDGATWSQSVNAAPNVTDIYADEEGFIAVGYFYPGAGCAYSESDAWGTTWTSVDGSTWRQMPDAGWHHRYISTLRRLGRTLIGIGVDWKRGRQNGSIWLADLPQVSQEGPTPEPTPAPTPNEGCG